ncbi:MAG: hypothetical protein QNJ69_10270 [Gammaproteobacteria bacterium]|nr:hypothetical protein [Gammaproteobacteria bacterium]
MVTSNKQQAAQEFVHSIDEEGRICFVNDAWLTFAAENDWPITAEAMIGSKLMASIMDPETRHIYSLLIDRAREQDQQARFNYRCDSPGRRRLLQMHISLNRTSQHIEFRSRILSSVKRQPIALIDPSQKIRSDEILKMCSWCKSIWDEHHWIELEQAVQQLGFLTAKVLPRISHGICNVCSERMTSLIVKK